MQAHVPGAVYKQDVGQVGHGGLPVCGETRFLLPGVRDSEHDEGGARALFAEHLGKRLTDNDHTFARNADLRRQLL